MSSGCRPLSDTEVQAVLESFSGPYKLRNIALFITGLKTGYRVKELLSLRLSDVIQYGRIVESLSVRRCNMKGKTKGRTVRLHAAAQEALLNWIKKSDLKDPEDFIFGGRKGGAITRVQAWRILDKAFVTNEMQGQLGTHSMRKTFAKKVYNRLEKDLLKTKSALGHTLIDSTVKYLSFDQDDVDQAILGD